MSPLGRMRRHADAWSSPHERARSLAAERLDGPLDIEEDAWLDGHLDECAECRMVAAAYASDRLALRSLRDLPVEPPRDLWARTAAGIEREAARSGRSSRTTGEAPRGASTWLPIGALSGIAVVVLVVVATGLSGGWLDRTVVPEGSPGIAAASPATTGASLVAPATPMAVAVGNVGWLRQLSDGAYAYNDSAVDHVCPPTDQPGCAALDESVAKRIALASRPKTIIGSPTNDQAVVVGSDGSGADQVLVMSLPKPSARPTAAASPGHTPSGAPSEKPAETPASTATATPSASATASTSGSATTKPTTAPSETATAEPTSTAETSEAPSESPGSESTAPSASPTETPSETPASASPSSATSASPQATAAAIAIASGVTVVGQSAAFSSDGEWFGFTARPADGSAGPDIYVWRVGDPTARRLTSDGQSVFGSWDGAKVVGSRLVKDDQTGELVPQSFIADPADGDIQGEPVALWRPVVDPSGSYAVAWSGSVVADATGTILAPGKGELVLTSWQPDADSAATRSRLPGSGDEAVTDFDVRWDESGSWLAVWVAGTSDPSIGRLSLYRLDAGSGTLVRPKGAPTDVAALPGFSIADGRLAWVTPHGQDAEGSKVQVVAWSGDGVGTVESVPADEVVVVR